MTYDEFVAIHRLASEKAMGSIGFGKIHSNIEDRTRWFVSWEVSGRDMDSNDSDAFYFGCSVDARISNGELTIEANATIARYIPNMISPILIEKLPLILDRRFIVNKLAKLTGLSLEDVAGQVVEFFAEWVDVIATHKFCNMMSIAADGEVLP